MITEFLGQHLGYALPQIALLTVGFFVEKRYVSRVTVLTNSTAVAIHVLSKSDPGLLVSLYSDLGLALGAFGFAYYVVERSNGPIYRNLAFYLYSSTNVAILILTDSLLAAAVGGLVLQFGLINFIDPDRLTHFGPYSFDVDYFIDTESIPLYNPDLGRNEDVPLTDYFDT